MLKYLSAAMVAAALLAAPSLVTAAGVAQPVNTPLITQPVADYGAKPTKRPKGYKAYKGGKRYGMHRGYKKHKKHVRHYGRVKVKYGKPAPRPYKAAAPKAYKPAPAKSGY
jgi:hypothetical protein